MAQANLIDLLKGTLQQIQQQNNKTVPQQKADPSIFDFLKDKLAEVDRSTKSNIEDKNGNNVGVFDMILDKINGAQKENREDPNVKTAPGNIFDMLRDAITQQKTQTQHKQAQRAEESIGDIIRQYNLDVRNISQETLQQIQQKYVQDNAELDKKYAQYIYDLNMGKR